MTFRKEVVLVITHSYREGKSWVLGEKRARQKKCGGLTPDGICCLKRKKLNGLPNLFIYSKMGRVFKTSGYGQGRGVLNTIHKWPESKQPWSTFHTKKRERPEAFPLNQKAGRNVCGHPLEAFINGGGLRGAGWGALQLKKEYEECHHAEFVKKEHDQGEDGLPDVG